MKGGGAKNPAELPPLNLAYLGDAVFELYARGLSLAEGVAPVDRLHKRTRGMVNASAQARMYFKLLPLLTEEELAVMKRGRNAKSFTKAKNATVADYRHATGLEALFGFLHLRGESGRLARLFAACTTEEEDDYGRQ